VFKKLLLITFFVMALISAILVILLNYHINQPLAIKKNEFITIKKGMSVNSFSLDIVEREWAETRFWLRSYVKLKPELSVLKSGTYLIESGMNTLDLLTLLVEGKEYQFKLTFIEGTTFNQWLTLLSSQPYLTKTLANKSVSQIAGLLAISAENPEGWFYPETYAYTAGESDFSILKRAHGSMVDKLNLLWQGRDKTLPYDNAYQALIMASIIEKESGKVEEQPLISSVFVNRLHKKMRLQTDPTIIYGLGKRYKGDIKRAHKYEKTAYNTYRINGLPPTPIAMPGGSALLAAMQPVSSSYLYFVGKGDGFHHFSENLKEHNRAVNKYQRNK